MVYGLRFGATGFGPRSENPTPQDIFIWLEQKDNIFIEIRQILSELYNILRKKINGEQK